MKMRWAGALATALCVGTIALSAYAGGADVKDSTGKVIGRVSVIGSGIDATTSMYCLKGNNGLGYVPYYARRGNDYGSQDIKIVEREAPGYGTHAYTIKPNGDIYDASPYKKVGNVTQTVGVARSSYTVWFTDANGKKLGYAYWTAAASGGGLLYDANNKIVGRFGSSADDDMRFVAFFFFYIAPAECK
jgi:hypothetical protein